MIKNRRNTIGLSYAARVEEITAIYDQHSRDGLSNREILRRFIYPKYPICERTFYNIINACADERVINRIDELKKQEMLFV